MFNWAKQTLASVAGTQEPIYGPEAIHSVVKETEETPWTETTRSDFLFEVLDHTSVETQTFYIMSPDGTRTLLQLVYSNVVNLRTTCQFNCKVFPPKRGKYIWSGSQLDNHTFNEDGSAFYADGLELELDAAGTTWSIKSSVDAACVVNVKITRQSPGFKAGQTGASLYGTDPKEPWGRMRHAFWPRCKAEGVIRTPDGELDMAGLATYIYALQGMKPHHAAAQWKFAAWQGPTHSAVLMEFTTPPSYGSTVVCIGGIAKDGEVVTAGPATGTHVDTRLDKRNGWSEPTHVRYEWKGKQADGTDVEAKIDCPTEECLDMVDIMAEVPGFVKVIVSTAVGTKPFIYQYAPVEPTPLHLRIGDVETEEVGSAMMEASFVCE